MSPSTSLTTAPADTTADDDPTGDSRWRTTVTVMLIAQLASGVAFSASIPFLPLLVHQLGSQSSLNVELWAGIVISGQAVATMISAPLWGALGDRWGRKPMVTRAMFGSAVAMASLVFASSVEQVALLYALQGALGGTVPTASALVAAAVPRSRLGKQLGMLHVSHWIGLGLGPLIGGVLFDAVGFAATFGLTSCLLTAGGLLVVALVQEKRIRPPPPSAPANRPKRARLSLGQDQWLAYSGRFASSLGRFMILPIMPLLILDLTGTGANAATLTGVASGASAVSGILGAYVGSRFSDRIGQRPVIAGCAIAAMLFIAPLGYLTEVWHLVSLYIVAGIAVGAIVPSLSALLAAAAPKEQLGAIFGLDSSVMAAARAVAPLLGAAIATTLGFSGSFIVAGAAYGLTALVMFHGYRRRRFGHD